MIELYDYQRSSAAFRVRIALGLKGLEWQSLPVNLLEFEQRGDAYLAVNPQGLVPALRLEDGALVTQSLAILEWLEETHPEPALLPAASLDRARVRALMYAIACDIHPLNNLRVLRYITRELGHSEDEKLAWYHHWLRQGFDALEQQVTGEDYCYGGELSLADVCLVPQMFNARRFELDLAPYPRLVAISRHLESIQAFASAAP
ncbi:maleylacetoacetate isomerase [Parahaliea maris]|uniref:maleylacetoacetate isomerase n=1 Tax=Parahaliea maris TaxID=2716870 RepID=UPI00164F9AD0|nr:maleylacetoacetate isomerase [Parahaliea maris]